MPLNQTQLHPIYQIYMYKKDLPLNDLQWLVIYHKTKQIYPTRVEGLDKKGGAHGVMVIVVGNGHGDTSSNSGCD